MGRTAVYQQYQYAATQKNVEDYDLWLRLAADGHVIEKLDNVLLLYRVHKQSVTSVHLQKGNTFWKLYTCKKRYLRQRIRSGKFNGFDARVSAWMLFDLARAPLKTIKRKLSGNT
jgi:hypothetical protein